jgi:hypothetical protein
MRQFQINDVPAALKALGVGGVLGSTLGIAAFHVFPHIREAGLTVQDAGVVGAALTTLLTRIIQAIGPTIAHYLIMVQIDLAVRIGWLQSKRAMKYRQELQDRFFGATPVSH